jgi:hypothetical protein
MKKSLSSLSALQTQYRSLARSLARTGFISRGSIFERKAGTAGSRYQWSWKDPRQKTLSLSLSPTQYQWLKEAIARQQTLEKTLRKMRLISYRILLDHVTGPPRRKQLSIKVLDII